MLCVKTYTFGKFIQVYWSILVQELSIIFHERPKSILDTSDNSKLGGVWFSGALLNIAESCLLPRRSPKKTDDGITIVWRDEGFDGSPVKCLSLRELRKQVMYVAFTLSPFVFLKFDAMNTRIMTCSNYISCFIGSWFSSVDNYPLQKINQDLLS